MQYDRHTLQPDQHDSHFRPDQLLFRSRKEGSRKARFGRSKKKRSDCKLLVLALCINKEGFIRYSSILAGNTAAPSSLPDMIDTLAAKTRVPNRPDKKTLVVMDAGIVTEENLSLIKERGYFHDLQKL